MNSPVVATIGTTHPLAFAGLVFAALALADDGARPVVVIAGITAQDGRAVTARFGVDGATIAAQFAALREAGVGAFHVGALITVEAVRSVAAGLASHPGIPVVVDPVLAASSGDSLGGSDVVDALRTYLLPRATLVTPNLDEAAAFTNHTVGDATSMHDAAAAFVAMGAQAALVKGGHGDAEREVIDVLVDARGARQFSSARIPHAMRGTGDLLAVSIAANLARAMPLDDAVAAARARVAAAIATGCDFAGTRVKR